MEIRRVTAEKKAFLNLLLLADEQEDMIDRYLERGEMFAGAVAGRICAVAVVTRDAPRTCELKNLAVAPAFQRRGLGAEMVRFLCRTYAPVCDVMLVGTGDSPLTVPFYRACGFTESHRVRNFFTDHYDHPIWEAGHQLVDMVYFKRDL